MSMLLKYTLRSIGEKKLRTLLIVVAITLSVALTFSSLALKDTITGSFKEMVKKYFGTANILITATKNSPSNHVPLLPLEDSDQLIDYQIGTVEARATYRYGNNQKQMLTLRGYTEEDMANLGVVKLTETLEGDFSGKMLYISNQLAKRYNWQLGETIDVTIGEARQKLTIAGIGTPTGALSKDGQSFMAVMPTDALRQIVGIQGKYEFLLVKSAEGVPLKSAMALLEARYPRYKVDEPIPWDVVSQQLNSITMPFMFMLLLVLATSVFIIYTAFKVIATEKMPVLGTFRSIGATKGHTNAILLLESALYGILGAGLGLLLGQLILDLMGNLMAQGLMQGDAPAKSEAVAQSVYYFAAGGLGILLSTLSALVPILQVSKVPLRDVVLGSTQSARPDRRWPVVAGFLLLAGSVLFPTGHFKDQAAALIGLMTLLGCLGSVLMVPFLTELLLRTFSPVANRLGNLTRLSLLNIRGNKSILDNISLITIGLSGIILINTISGSINKEVIDVYNTADYQVTLSVDGLNRTTLQGVVGIPGVTGTLGIYETYGIKIAAINDVPSKGKKLSLGGMTGISDDEYFDYWQFPIVGSLPENIDDQLATERTLILTTTLKERLGVKTGDTLTLEFSEDVQRDYHIAGFVKTLMNNGDMALASASALKRDANLVGYSSVLIKTDQPDAVKAALMKRYEKQSPYVKTMSEMISENNTANAAIIIGLQGFSVMAMVIGMFGIFNNFVVSLLSRQRTLAVMKSIGMSRKQTRRLLTQEAMISGLIGGTLATVSATVLILQVSRLLETLNLPIPLHYSWQLFVGSVIAGGVISMVANLLPAIQSSRLNIVKSIKFE